MIQSTISTGFQNILENYLKTTQAETNTKSSAIYPVFLSLTKSLQASQPLRLDSDFVADFSCGKGGWAFVPWIAVFHNQETNSTQKGVYVIYLFRQDMQGFYLTLNQGVTSGMDYKVTGKERYHKLHKTAQQLRGQCQELVKSGFKLDNSIDLKATSALGKNYVQSTIAHKYYDANKIPNDKEILKDLTVVLGVYKTYVETR